MQRTVYSLLPSEELVEFAIQRDNATQMEIELAQRLTLAMDMLEELRGSDARSEGEGRRQKAAR